MKTSAGVVYVPFVVDTFSRRIVGWSAATVRETVFVLDALEMALRQRDRGQYPFRAGELVHRSDAGSQYTSFRLAEHLQGAGIAASIGFVGDAYDKGLMESTIGLFKTELVKPQRLCLPKPARSCAHSRPPTDAAPRTSPRPDQARAEGRLWRLTAKYVSGVAASRRPSSFSRSSFGSSGLRSRSLQSLVAPCL